MSTRIRLRCWDIMPILLLIVPVSRSEKNVALAGTAKQSANQDDRWTADKAIDNCINQTISGTPPHCCAHTADKNHKQAWWRVDLGQRRTIQYITIYYRNNSRPRFGGYSLSVSNSTDNIQDILCYQDNSSKKEEVDLNPTHLCPYVARYVTVYNNRESPKRHDWYSDYPILELCEVQVLGCQIGSYGNHSCNDTCPESCYGGNCNAITGSCFYCFPGMFGVFCEQHCSANCNNTCEKESGHCIGCKPGQKGDLCNAKCSPNCVICDQTSDQCFVCVNGKYGDDCEQDCSNNCKNRSCMKENGYCLDCVNGKYGDMCGQDCSDNCKDHSCMKNNGSCLGN
ncbi:cell death abnormality protein 1-like [Mizuhopecten yessoensis]|uniref:cell death abnormality protein 1-like n=1 Tax=Mizuhopecten yessoensis TaxID=6573 RepID=UPI000B45B51D|nr:cell death abnormality protein 1-like [Mizuhopecten yessoensis]